MEKKGLTLPLRNAKKLIPEFIFEFSRIESLILSLFMSWKLDASALVKSKFILKVVTYLDPLRPNMSIYQVKKNYVGSFVARPQHGRFV